MSERGDGWNWFGGGEGDQAAEVAEAAETGGGPADPAAEPPVDPSAGRPAELAAGLRQEPAADLSAEPAPEPTGRARFRVLTGGRSATAAPAEPQETVTVDDGSDTESPSAPPPADFRVRCPDCGPQYVAVADVRFVSTGGGADTDRYLFTCPACGTRVRRPAGPELARILKTSGVATLALRRGPDQAL